MIKKKGAAKNAAKKTPAPKPVIDHAANIATATEALTAAETAVNTAIDALNAAKDANKPEEETKPLEDAVETAKKGVEDATTALNAAKDAAENSSPGPDEDEEGGDEDEEELPEGNYTVKVNLKHYGQRYAPGDVIEIGGDEGALLLAQGAIE